MFLVKFVLSHESYFIKYYIVFCGLLLGLATLTRPIAFYISLIFMFIIYYKNRRGAGLIYALFFLFVFFVTISPWIMRNYYVFNSFSLSTVGYYNLLVLNVSQLEYSKNRKELSEIQKELLLQSDSLMLKDGKNPLELNQFMKSYYWKRLALSKIFQNPIEYFILSMKG